MLKGINDGYFHREIQESSYKYQQRVDAGKETVVGVNEYQIEEDTPVDVLEVDPQTRDRQLARLGRVKDERDDVAVEEPLEEAIDSDENVMPYLIDAVKVYATMGEIMAVFEEHHGAYEKKIGLA